jgi:hypothetical protein
LLHRLLRFPKVELFVNVIWRELDMAIQLVRKDAKPTPTTLVNTLFDNTNSDDAQASNDHRAAGRATLEATLNSVFHGAEWRKIDSQDADERADQCADLFRKIYGAKWGTHLRMKDNGRVRYYLLHLTNHPYGRDLMKDCMWKACPTGGFYASKEDNPHQVQLIQPEPDLSGLVEWVRKKLAQGPKRWEELGTALRAEWWLDKHLNESIRAMKQDGEIEPEGKFARSANPLLRLKTKQ